MAVFCWMKCHLLNITVDALSQLKVYEISDTVACDFDARAVTHVSNLKFNNLHTTAGFSDYRRLMLSLVQCIDMYSTHHLNL